MFGDLVLTHDIMVAGVHFPIDADPADVAWKLVAVNLSDLAANGAQPLGILLGYMLGENDWDRRFASGLADALDRFDAALWGGDTVAAPPARSFRAIGLTAIGRAMHLPAPSRGGAQAGDGLWVTGSIGDAMIGFEADRTGDDRPLAALARFRRPIPRIAEGIALAPQVTAMMDVSDGLLLDASRLARSSGITADVVAADVPMSASANHRRDDALRWGDDYELLFTLPDGVDPRCAATRIGTMLPNAGLPLLIDGRPPLDGARLGYQHRG